MSLIKKEYKSVEELNNLKTKDHELCSGSCALSQIYQSTKLVVVGSFFPPRLVYCYNENPYIYKSFDVSRRKNLFHYKKKYDVKSMSQEERLELSKTIHDIVKSENVAFIDIAQTVLTKKGSTKDKDIVGFVPNSNFLNILKERKDIKVISITQAVEEYLNSRNILNRYVKVFPGRSNRYPKGTNLYKVWEEVFDSTKN